MSALHGRAVRLDPTMWESTTPARVWARYLSFLALALVATLMFAQVALVGVGAGEAGQVSGWGVTTAVKATPDLAHGHEAAKEAGVRALNSAGHHAVRCNAVRADTGLQDLCVEAETIDSDKLLGQFHLPGKPSAEIIPRIGDENAKYVAAAPFHLIELQLFLRDAIARRYGPGV